MIHMLILFLDDWKSCWCLEFNSSLSRSTSRSRTMRYCCLRITIVSVLLAASAVFGSVAGDQSNEEMLELQMRQREKHMLDEVNRELHQHVHMSMSMSMSMSMPPPPPHDPHAHHHHWVSETSKPKKSGKKHHKHHKHPPKHESPKASKNKSSKKHGKGSSSSKGYYSKGKGTGPVPIGKGKGVFTTPSPTTPTQPTPIPQPTISPKPTDEPGPTVSPGTPTTGSQPPVAPSTGSPTVVGGPTGTPPPFAGISAIPTAPPTPQGSGSVDLLSYQLLYTIDQFRLPLPSEFETVGDLTKAFVNNYFGTIYPTTLLSAETVLVDGNFNFGAPVDMLYNTTLMFSPGSEFPPEDQLNTELEAAFTGDSMASYLAIIQELPPSNIFETTSSVAFQRLTPPSPLFENSARDSSISVSSSTGEVKGFFTNPIVQYTGIAMAAGAACFVIIVTGLLLQDRRTTPNSRKPGDGGNRNAGRAGSMSVTGHTVELSSSTDSRSVTPYSRSAAPMALGHHQRSITLPQHEQVPHLGSMDSTVSQGEWEEIVQARHHTGSVGVHDDDEDEDDEADDDASHLMEHQLLHDVNLSST